MECVTSIVSGIVVKIAETTVGPLYRQVGHLFNYKSNLQSLRSQVGDLGAAKERIQHTIDEEKRKGKRVEADVENWLTKVGEITDEVETFLKDERHAKTKCLNGFCPNPILQYRLSRKSKNLVHKVEAYYEKREFPGVAFSVPPQEVRSILSQDYLAFESRTSIVKDILEELKNPDTNLIGVYGIGGVGKTTLAKEIFTQAKQDKLFDDVVIVLDVKLIPDLAGIQKQILEKLGMDVIEGQTIAIRASQLWDRIKEKTILVILDDVSEKIDLEAVGLHRVEAVGLHHVEAVGLRHVEACNILLTARTRPVLFSEMRTQKDFQLNLLSETETWRLFEMFAGDVVKEDPIRKVAMEVANKCGGLPILVVTVASALRIGNLFEWNDALRRLKKFDMKSLAEKALLTLEWSYDQLDAEELKPFFLLCGINAWQENIDLDYCFKYSVGLGLLKNVDTMEEARNAFHALIKKLQNFCLLQDGNNYTTVRMHELVRNVAIRIARRDQHVLLKGFEEEFKEWPNEDFFEKCTMISLRGSNIPSLPQVPWQCRELKLLEFSNDSIQIPCNFFEDMKRLKERNLISEWFAWICRSMGPPELYPSYFFSPSKSRISPEHSLSYSSEHNLGLFSEQSLGTLFSPSKFSFHLYSLVFPLALHPLNPSSAHNHLPPLPSKSFCTIFGALCGVWTKRPKWPMCLLSLDQVLLATVAGLARLLATESPEDWCVVHGLVVRRE